MTPPITNPRDRLARCISALWAIRRAGPSFPAYSLAEDALIEIGELVLEAAPKTTAQLREERDLAKIDSWLADPDPAPVTVVDVPPNPHVVPEGPPRDLAWVDDLDRAEQAQRHLDAELSGQAQIEPHLDHREMDAALLGQLPAGPRQVHADTCTACSGIIQRERARNPSLLPEGSAEQKAALDELTRLTEEMGGYDAEFTKQDKPDD